MRYVVMLFIVLAACTSSAFAQCGPNRLQTCAPSKVPEPGIFGGNYSTCSANGPNQTCWDRKDSISYYPDGTPWVVQYCLPVRKNSSCGCVQGEGLVDLTGVCQYFGS
jgi:hypothetical protein